MTPSEKFQQLLRELFQFDSSDLDFGIYRIMNFKRDAIEGFIQKDLVEAVSRELSAGALASQGQAVSELRDLAAQINETLGSKALNGDGQLNEAFHETPLGQRYLELQARSAGAKARESQEAAVFNHLYAFFSRYYDDGDFLSKRRYSRKEKYAIPYNGEEVHLHWANADQYYIKTTEQFTDYRFKTNKGVSVHFKLQAASVERDNLKGDQRFFLIGSAGAALHVALKEVLVPFEYRPLTEAEVSKYGKRNQQDAIISAALEQIPAQIQAHAQAQAAIQDTHHRSATGEAVSFLEYHLRRYARRNTSDYFIHKNLKAFLARELDFFLKNEVLNLDEIEAGGETRAEGWFQLLRVIRAVGTRIIEFLAQMEEFQKKLFEKRKFITETQYCITVGNIDASFYGEIASNEPQWAEWRQLFAIDEESKGELAFGKDQAERRAALLKNHPTLVLDTKHFAAGFVDRLLGSFEDLEQMTDGLLVNGENFQALQLLSEKHRDGVKCVYIDPPYNTGSDDFLYKDGYQASTWAAMLTDRIALAVNLLAQDGLLCMQIGDEEAARSQLLLDRLLSERKNTVVVRRGIKNVQAQFSDITRLTLGHDLIHIYAKSAGVRVPHLRQAHEIEKPGKWDTFWRGTNRPSMRYKLFDQEPETGQWRWEEGRARRAVAQYEHYVVRQAAYKTLDEWYVENLQAGVDLDFVRANDGGVVQYYVPPQGHRLLSDNWLDVSAAGTFAGFATEKHTALLHRVLSWNTSPGDTVLDFFAGSGSTAHAAWTMTDGPRRWIAIEMGRHFDTVLVPRVKRAIYSPEWKDGKPKRAATQDEAERCPRVIKYLRLESYEDSLNNIAFSAGGGDLFPRFDDYLVKYMLDWETKDSATLLNLGQLVDPFEYSLTVTDGQETKRKVVDLPETFNFLLGLHVTRRQVLLDDNRRYLVVNGKLDHKTIIVIWRTTKEWKKEDYERDRGFVEANGLTEEADEVFVNGDSLIPGARSLDPVFKSRMFGGE